MSVMVDDALCGPGHFDPNIGLNAWNTLNTLKHTKTSLQTEAFDKWNLLHNCSRRLKSVMEDDALYASYFWWKDFYQVRTEALDNAQVRVILMLKIMIKSLLI